jgi:hypothetical protein
MMQSTVGTVNRTSDTAATMSFTSDETVRWYYRVVADDPNIDTSSDGIPFSTNKVTLSCTALTAGAKDI